MIFIPFFVIAGLIAGGLLFVLQSFICDKVENPRLRTLPMWIVGGVLLICSLLWLFGIPTTVLVTGPGKLAVYDHIILAIVLAPGFVAMEAAWLLHNGSKEDAQHPLYGKGVLFSMLSVAMAVCGGALGEIFQVIYFPAQIRTALILGAILLMNTLHRWIKFNQPPANRGIVMDVAIAAGILLAEAWVVTLLPETIYLSLNIQTALGTTAAVYLILAVVFQFVLNQDDRPGVYAMLRLLLKWLTYIAVGAMVLWIVWYQINCDDNKSFVMALAFFGPILLGLLMGYLLLLRRNGSLQFEDVKAQNTVHGFLPIALALLCFLSGAVQFSNMRYQHEVRSRVTYWDVYDLDTGDGIESVLSLDLKAIDQASGMQSILREEIDGRVELTLVGYWSPFRSPWEFGTMFIRLPADGSITQICVNDEYASSHSVVLRYNTITDMWEEAR